MLRAFDAAIIPYQLNEFTAHVSPAKLNEYFAMGLPTVATPLPELRRFNASHGGELVALARTPAGFAAAVLRAIADRSPARVRERVAAARTNRWDARIDAMSAIIADALARRRRKTA